MPEWTPHSLTPPDSDSYISSSFGKWYGLILSSFWIYLWLLINFMTISLSNLQVSRNINSDLQDGGSVDMFLRQKFIYWLEALSLMKFLSSGVIMIEKLENRLQVSFSLLFYLYHSRTIADSLRPIKVRNYMRLYTMLSDLPYLTDQLLNKRLFRYIARLLFSLQRIALFEKPLRSVFRLGSRESLE